MPFFRLNCFGNLMLIEGLLSNSHLTENFFTAAINKNYTLLPKVNTYFLVKNCVNF